MFEPRAMSDFGRTTPPPRADVSSIGATTSNSSGIGCKREQVSTGLAVVCRHRRATCLPVHLVLLVLLLLLDHQHGVVEEEHLQLGALALRAAALLERTLVDHLAILVAQAEVDLLVLLEDELLIELGEVEPVLAPARLEIDLAEELAHELDDAGQHRLVGVVVGRLFEHGLEQERVSRQARRRLAEVGVEFELARLGQPLRLVDKLGERRVRALLLLELVLAVQLVRTVLDERREKRHNLEEDVADFVDHVRRLLPFVEQFGEPHADSVDLEHVPEHLRHEVLAPFDRDDVLCP